MADHTREVSLNEVAVKTDGGSAPTHSPASASKPGATGEYTCDEHLMSIADLATKWNTSLNVEQPNQSKGITDAEAAKRLKEFGENAMSPPKGIPEWLKFLLKFTDKFMLLLVAAGVLCHVAYGLDKTQPINLYLGIVLYGIVIITCTMTFLQERSTASVMDAIKGMLASSCTVIRDGAEQRIDPRTLVPGDLVRLGLGDRVPADMRIIFTQDLKTEQSSLTGEPDAIAATVAALHEMPIEARNIVFSSSLVHNGEGYGVVTRTGDNTMIGSIASLASSGGSHETLLQLEIHRFVNFIAIIAIVSAFIFFGIGMGRHQPVVSTFVNGFIVVIVANIPEGLPATVTSCLSITAKRMAARNVLIKRTDIIESLGSASVIASDKTGTLTQNRMTVENMWYNRTAFNAYAGARPDLLEMMQPSVSVARRETDIAAQRERTGSYKLPPLMDDSGAANVSANETSLSGPKSFNEEKNSFTVGAFASFSKVSWDRFSPHAKLLTLAGVCNRARYEEATAAAAEPKSAMQKAAAESDRKILGDASDSGLLRYCDKMYPVAIARQNFPKLFEVPFNSVNKFAITVVSDPGNSKQNIVFMKGAPEIILARCSEYMYNQRTRPIDEDFKDEWTQAYERFGSMGERVLGFAYKVIDAHKADAYAADKEGALVPTRDLVFCGLVSLVDPPRPGVAEAIQTCRKAGIKVTMVTGDHPLTAEAIARKVNIITRPTRRDVALEDGVPESSIAISDERVEAMVVTGSQVGDLTQQDWDDILSKKEVVFARTSPQQKLKLVENYQRRGEVVAVTGDGVNDSPALKKAQIGVAMGSENASDVAREAADIILLDDNFTSIVGAIEEGRTLFDNLKKTIAYTLAHLWPELVPVFLNLAFSFPLALNGLLILTIDLLTEQGPAISLAFENSEAAVMLRKPRNTRTERLVSAPSLIYAYIIAGIPNAAVSMFCYFMVYVTDGISVANLYNTVPIFWNVPDVNGVFANNADGNPARNLVICKDDRRDDLGALMSANAGFWLVLAEVAFVPMATQLAAVAAMNISSINATVVALGFPAGLNASSLVGVSGGDTGATMFVKNNAQFVQLTTSLPVVLDNNTVAQPLLGFPSLSKSANDAWAAQYAAWTPGSKMNVVVDPGYMMGAVTQLGCNVWTPAQQWMIYSESQAAFYLTLVLCQFWHIWACRTRVVSIFKHGLLSNVVTIYGCLAEIGIIVAVIYIPVFQKPDSFQTTNLRGVFWLPQFIYGLYITVYNETVKYIIRRDPEGRFAQYFGW